MLEWWRAHQKRNSGFRGKPFVDEVPERPRCLNSTARGYTMPAFSFEKISPPVRRGPIAPIETKQRGVIVQILDRFVQARVKRALKEEKGVIVRPEPPAK
jgi:hypothetical protein